MDQQDLRERTNPVFNTAKATLLHLVAVGDPDAKEFARRLGIDLDAVFSDEQRRNAMTAGNLVMLEARYESMNRFIEASGADTVVDLPCGYTPRALRAQMADRHYIGCDLPAVIDEVGPLVREALAERNMHTSVEHHAVDATNYASLRAALANAKGPLCITTEGLLMYLTDDELRQVCTGMRRILAEFGGRWLTPDPEVTRLTMGVMRAVMGARADANLKASSGAYSQKADIRIGWNVLTVHPLKEGSLERALDFARDCGMKVKRVPVADGLPELRIFEKLSPEQREGVLAVSRDNCIWELTPDEAAGEPATRFESEAFALRADVLGSDIAFALKGRLDSITAPRLLEAFEKLAGDASGGVDVNCAELEYISSAGLRVLMLMVKQGRRVRVLGASEELRALLEQTGFDQILEIPEA